MTREEYSPATAAGRLAVIGAHMVDSAANIVYIGARSWTAWHQEMDAVIEIVEGRQE